MGSHILHTFLGLEREKGERSPSYYPNAGDDVCDAQSARSDSCVSEEEYQDVYNFAKNKKKGLTQHHTAKKNKPRSNTLIYGTRPVGHELPSHPKLQQHTSVKVQAHEEFRSETLVQRGGKERLNVTDVGEKENLPRSRADHKRDFSIKLTKYRTLPKTTPPLKKINQTGGHEESDVL